LAAPLLALGASRGDSPLELPKPPWYRRVWILNLAIAVVVVAVLVGATVALGSHRDRQANPTMVTGAAPVTTPPARAAPTQPPTTQAPRTTASAKRGLLWQKSGGDGVHPEAFEAPDGWRLEWSFDCSSFARYGGGNFKITGEGKLDRVSVQRFAVKGSGAERIAGGGRGRLVIETVCDRWTVKATAP
jgi:hypothetical protein